MKENEKKNKKLSIAKKIILIILVLGVLFSGMYYFLMPKEVKKQVKEKIKVEAKSNIKIVDLDSNERPIAVMIDNHDSAKHAGLQESYINYEIIVEGGLTRIMALFKDKQVDLIGPVRSSRHYFLDYAMENSAIYAHFGWSNRAKEDISSLGINNMNGITNASKAYWRDNNIAAPHNVYTNTENLQNQAESMGYDLESTEWQLLEYSEKNIDLSTKENSMVAKNIDLIYSSYHTTGYYYDEETKTYLRSMNNTLHNDYVTGKTYTAKNIIIEKVKNYSFDSYGRQDLENIGTGEGYYITNGYAVPITWAKDARGSKTKYTYLDGTNVSVNDGNTWIQIMPINSNINIASE